MSQQELQNRLNDISPEAMAKVQRAKNVSESAIKVDHEWLAIAEMGKHFGWAAIESILPEIKEDGLSGEYMTVLLTAARKIDASVDYRASRAAFVGSGAAQAGKKATQSFDSMTKHLLKQAEADE